MILTEFFRLRKPEGTDPVNVEDFNDNFDVIDTELNNRPTKTGAATNMVTVFSQASARANLTSGETIATSFGKLMKWFADLKTVAFSGSYSDLSSKPTLGTSASHTVVEDYDDAAAITEAGYVTGGKVAAAIIKNLSKSHYLSTNEFASKSLATALASVCDAYASNIGTYNGRFNSSDSWFSFNMFNSGSSWSGILTSTGATSTVETYAFYRLAGADAVLKKLGSPEIRTKTVTNASGSFDAGGTVLFAGFVKTTCHISTYAQKYGHSSYPLATVTYSGSTITYLMGIDKTKENDVSGQDSYSATIIYAIE